MFWVWTRTILGQNGYFFDALKCDANSRKIIQDDGVVADNILIIVEFIKTFI